MEMALHVSSGEDLREPAELEPAGSRPLTVMGNEDECQAALRLGPRCRDLEGPRGAGAAPVRV